MNFQVLRRFMTTIFVGRAEAMIRTAGNWNRYLNKPPNRGMFEQSSARLTNAFYISEYFFCLFRPDNDAN